MAKNELRAALDSAFDQVANTEASEGDEEEAEGLEANQEEVADGSEVEGEVEGEEGAGEGEEGADANEGEEPEPAQKEPVKDAKAKKGAKKGAKPDAVDGEEAEGAGDKTPKKDVKGVKKEPVADKKAPVSSEPAGRAPGSWKPAVREKWASLPKEVQTEVLRRETEISRAMSTLGRVQTEHKNISDIFGAHQHIIAAEGGDALKFTKDLYTTAAGLYSGSPQQKVQLVAGLIKSFAVDIQLLDDYMSNNPDRINKGGGAGGQDAGQFIQQQINAALAPILQRVQQNDGKTAEQQQTELQEFATDPDNEFFMDLKEDMADIMELAAKKGQKMDLSAAYKRAIVLHPEIAEIVADRDLRSKAEARSAAAKAARKKSVSVRGAPTRGADGGKKSGSLRADLDASWEQHS